MPNQPGDSRLSELVRTTGSGRPYGITEQGFVPKPVSRLLDEKLAAARELFGDDVDLTSGSALRKLLEIVSMEESRCWTHLGLMFESTRVSTAVGDALSQLGAEVGLPRPHHRAEGVVSVDLEADLPESVPEVRLPRGTRLLTPGGHDYFLDESVTVSNAARNVTAPVRAFEPGPAMNLDPTVVVDEVATQRLDRFSPLDPRADLVRSLAAEAGSDVVVLTHDTPTTGGELYWSDERYRDLLLGFPRNLWTPESVRLAVSLVPGVRQVLVKDLYGGLDINQSIFGNFNFLERLFSEERSLGNPYYVTVLVAPEDGALWNGPGQLRERVREAVDRVRPIGIAPKIETAEQVGVGFAVRISVDGLPVPQGTPDAVNASPEAVALKGRILDRVRRYVAALRIGEPVRYSELLWAVMEEPGVADARELRLKRYPPELASLTLGGTGGKVLPQTFTCEQDVPVGPTEIAVLVDLLEEIRIG